MEKVHGVGDFGVVGEAAIVQPGYLLGAAINPLGYVFGGDKVFVFLGLVGDGVEDRVESVEELRWMNIFLLGKSA